MIKLEFGVCCIHIHVYFYSTNELNFLSPKYGPTFNFGHIYECATCSVVCEI